MELTRDLLQLKTKSRFQFILGVLLILLAILWLVLRKVEDHNVRIFDWGYSSIFILNGVTHILGGRGINIEKLFGKAFISVNDQQIRIKPEIFCKEQSVDWADVKSIGYDSNKFIVWKKDESTMFVNLSKMDYSSLTEVKNAIETIGREKGVLA